MKRFPDSLSEIGGWPKNQLRQQRGGLGTMGLEIAPMVEKDLSGRVAELATRSTAGALSLAEQAEYEHIVRLNDLLSMLKLQAEE